MPRSLYELYRNVPKPELLSEAEKAEIRNKVNNNHQYGSDMDGRIAPKDVEQNIAVQIAYRSAEELLDWTGNEKLPLDADIIDKHPGVDPVGKYSEVDMMFAQRLDRVKRTAPLCEGPNREVLDNILHHMEKPIEAGSREMYDLNQNVERDCKAIRVNRVAAMFCEDKEGSEKLEEQANNLKNSPAIRYYDKLLTCLEHIAGLKDGELENQDKLATPDEKNMVNGTRGIMDRLLNRFAPNKQLHLGKEVQRDPEPNPTVYFPNFQNILKQNWYAYPGNWGKQPTPEAMTPKDSPYLQKLISQYCGAVAKKTMDEILPANAQNIVGDRNALVIVDGKTITEHMRTHAEKTGVKEENYTEWYNKNKDVLGMQILAAGVENGKRVEAFIPDANGNLPEKPVQITKSGDAAMDLRPVTLNAWERFFNRFGFYKEKAARADEYNRTMAARERVKALEHAGQIQKGDDIGHLHKNFFGQANEFENAFLENSRWDFYFNPDTVCVCEMLNKGFSLQDISDPNKCIDEKREIGKKFLDRYLSPGGYRPFVEGEHDVRTVFDGVMKLRDEYANMGKQVDFSDPKQYAEHNPGLHVINMVFSDFDKKKGSYVVSDVLNKMISNSPQVTQRYEDMKKLYESNKSIMKDIASQRNKMAQILKDKIDAPGKLASPAAEAPQINKNGKVL